MIVALTVRGEEGAERFTELIISTHFGRRRREAAAATDLRTRKGGAAEMAEVTGAEHKKGGLHRRCLNARKPRIAVDACGDDGKGAPGRREGRLSPNHLGRRTTLGNGMPAAAHLYETPHGVATFGFA